MDTTLTIFSIIFGIAGLVGCVLPVLPGPPLSWLGLLLISLTSKFGAEIGSKTLIIWALVSIVVTVLDYVVPIIFTKHFGGSKLATRGAAIGLFIGLFYGVVGIIFGPFIGALIGELLNNSENKSRALKVAFSSFVSFLVTTELKIIASVAMLYQICHPLFN